MGSLPSGRNLYHASFGFFLIVLLTKRIVFHVILKAMHQSMLLVAFLRYSVSSIQENHGRSDANGGWTIISAKAAICQKQGKVAACPLISVIARINHIALYKKPSSWHWFSTVSNLYCLINIRFWRFIQLIYSLLYRDKTVSASLIKKLHLIIVCRTINSKYAF
jgi:hypothetical protein